MIVTTTDVKKDILKKTIHVMLAILFVKHVKIKRKIVNHALAILIITTIDAKLIARITVVKLIVDAF